MSDCIPEPFCRCCECQGKHCLMAHPGHSHREAQVVLPAMCTTNGKPVSEVRAGQTNETGQHDGYIVLCPDERAKGFVRPYRDAYKHKTCGTVTTMGRALSETYARDQKFYGATFCCGCNKHLPVAEFAWTADQQEVGS